MLLIQQCLWRIAADRTTVNGKWAYLWSATSAYGAQNTGAAAVGNDEGTTLVMLISSLWLSGDCRNSLSVTPGPKWP